MTAESLSISILPFNSRLYGLTIGEWSVQWWRWFLSIPKESNPALDDDGSCANNGQGSFPVYFLCQTYEMVNIIPYRSITVPANRFIFMPIINWISVLYHDGQSDQELLDVARERMNVVANLKLMVNGLPLSQSLRSFRAVSPFFDLYLPENNIIGLKSGEARAISDGYWVFLKPNSSPIELASYGSCSSGRTRIGVRYKITLA